MSEQDNPHEEVDGEEWHTYKHIGKEVYVKINSDSNPVVCAVFDGDEKVTEEVAALQLEEQLWAAEGYKKAKEKYGVSLEDLAH